MVVGLWAIRPARDRSGLQPSGVVWARVPGALPQAGIGRAFGPFFCGIEGCGPSFVALRVVGPLFVALVVGPLCVGDCGGFGDWG
jgi:hypothetical protein